jgi:hypothetical protein
VNQGGFREDLFYRLNGISITAPPLRNRTEDIPALANYFLQDLNMKGKTNKEFAENVYSALMLYDFPGNVRELRNLVERAYAEAVGARIHHIPIEEGSNGRTESVEVLFKRLIEGRDDFWTSIYDRFRARELTPHSLRVLVHLGLRLTGGSYKGLAARFHLDDQGYRRLMDFLRRSRCLLDFRPYRRQGLVQKPEVGRAHLSAQEG